MPECSNNPPESQWIDVSVPLRTDMVHWPGDPPVKIERVRDLERGDSNSVSVISMGSHTGTHIDAPLHFLKNGAGVDGMSFDVAVGRARVIGIQDPESIKVEELVRHNIRHGERILFKTRNSSQVWKSDAFVQNFVFLSREAALFLSESAVALIGIDYLSVGGYKRNGSEVHRILLGAGVWLIEGLDLSQVVPGFYDLICLPLRLYRGDGAPARAILRPARVKLEGGRLE